MNQNQNPNQIKNPKTTQLAKTPEMNDRDFANDMLAMEKYMTDAYCTALNEASHQALYEDLALVFKETQDCQRDLFNLMFKKGWYKLEQEDQQKLQQSYQQFNNYKTAQFPYGTNTMQ